MEMTAKEYLEVRHRMCIACIRCEGCPLNSINNGRSVSCHELEAEYIGEAVEKVEQWSIDNPLSTNYTKLKEVFGVKAAQRLYLNSNLNIEGWFFKEYKGGK